MEVYNKIVELENLENIFLELSYNGGFNSIDKNEIKNLNIEKLEEELKNLTFKFSNPKYSVLKKGDKRRHFSFDIIGKIVSKSIYKYLSEIFDKCFIDNLFSSRKQKSHKQAVMLLQENMKKSPKSVVLRMDIEKYYDSINHEILISQLKKNIDDKTVNLIKNLLNVMSTNGYGIISGSSLSNLFGNIYLSDFDFLVLKNLNNPTYIRFVDDMTIICENISSAQNLKSNIEIYLKDKLKLKLSNKKSFITNVSDGCKFLGYKIFAEKLMILEEYSNSAKEEIEKILSGNSSLNKIQIKNKIKAIKSKIKNTDEEEIRNKLLKIDEFLKNDKNIKEVNNAKKELISLEIKNETQKTPFLNKELRLEKINLNENFNVIEEIRNINLIDLTPWEALLTIKLWKEKI